MMEMIQKKVDGEDISVTPTDEPEHKIIDMMAALKASIAGGDSGKTSRKPAKRAGKKAGAKKKAAGAK